jgi:hypothetical protein
MSWRVAPVDYGRDTDRAALVMLLDAYARDPMGGGEPLSETVKARLCDDPGQLGPQAFSFIRVAGHRSGGLGQLLGRLLHLQSAALDEHP